MTANATLVVAGASKSYGKVKALDGVSIDVAPGEFVALLGPNGAGKTTLFQLLSGLFVADGGSIRIDGHDIGRNAVPALAGLGIVFQQPTLDLDLGVADNLWFHARLHGIARERTKARIAAELERLGLAAEAKRKARELSGGNRRRVELARALLHEPRILLMDEATVGLDPASRRDLLAYVHELCRTRGMGVLWSTHLVEEAEGANRVIVLHRGKVLTSGAPAELAAASGGGSLQDAFLKLTKAPPPAPANRGEN